MYDALVDFKYVEPVELFELYQPWNVYPELIVAVNVTLVPVDRMVVGLTEYEHPALGEELCLPALTVAVHLA